MRERETKGGRVDWKMKESWSLISFLSQQTSPDLAMDEVETEKTQVILSDTLPRSAGPLDCGVAKGRAKGPPGRRLPRSVTKPLTMPSSMETLEPTTEALLEFRDGRGRATSLSALEHNNYPPPAEEGRPQTRLTFTTDPSSSESEPSTNHSSSPTNADSPDSPGTSGSVDFEHAWFLQIPPKPSHHHDEKTSDYSSLHDDLSSGSSSQSSSVIGTPVRRHPDQGEDGAQSPSPRPPSSTPRRYFCAIL